MTLHRRHGQRLLMTRRMHHTVFCLSPLTTGLLPLATYTECWNWCQWRHCRRCVSHRTVTYLTGFHFINCLITGTVNILCCIGRLAASRPGTRMVVIYNGGWQMTTDS